MLTTIEVIESYLGTALDSAETAVYETIIAAVDAYIEGFCDCQFTDAVYNERVMVSCGMFQTRNPAQFIYGFRVGAEDVIRVTPPAEGVITFDRLKTGGMTMRLIDGLAVSDEDLSTITIGGVQTMINADSAWDSVIIDVADSGKRALYMAEDTRQEDGEEFLYLQAYLTAANTRRQTIRLFSTDAWDTDGVVVYRGGFATIPADMQDAATRMVIKAYADRNPSTTVSGDLKGEKIGDYEYDKFTASEITTTIGSLAIPYQAVFDKYRNFSI